jgi:hypothetical protein
MTSPTTLELMQPVMLAVGPSLITGAVALFAPMLLDRRRQSIEAKKLRAQKFEELMEALYDYDHWVDRHRRKYASGADIEIGASPIHKLEALTSIHFPIFRDRLDVMETEAMRYVSWTVDAAEKRLEKLPSFMDGFRGAYEPYRQAFRKLVVGVGELGHSEFNQTPPSTFSRVKSWFSRR